MTIASRFRNVPLGTLRSRPQLVRERRDQKLYQAILFEHLSDRGFREVSFFINERRFYLFASLIGCHVGRPGPRILNVACGPFALEYYCRLDGCEIVSFDIDAGLGKVHADLSRVGLIDCHFFVGSAKNFAVDRGFDLVVINDLFYSTGVDFFTMIEECAKRVTPGGYLYFDIPDRRAAALWALAGKQRLARYNLDVVVRHLEALGLALVAAAPSMGVTGGLDEAVRRILWSSIGIANNTAFLARAKKPKSATLDAA